MSNALAIGAVTAVLRDLLNNGLIDHNVDDQIGTVSVTALPPDLVQAINNPSLTQLNLFLYQISRNPGWANVELPAFDSSGRRIAHPPVAVDLHYILSAYGSADYHQEILLGYAMQLLDETAIVPRAAIRHALAPPSPVDTDALPPGYRALAAADLADQFEMIKITPDNLDMDALAQIWSMFQSRYRPSVGYTVSVVIIEREPSTTPSLPVAEYKLYTRPFKQPHVERVDALSGPTAPIVPGEALVISGYNLRGERTAVKVGVFEVTPALEDLSDARIEIVLPAGLEPGVQGVQVVHHMMMGDPEVEHAGISSNVVPFVYHPAIARVGSTYQIDVVGSTVSGGFVSAEVRVTLTSPVGRAQNAMLLLNEFDPPDARPARAYSFVAPPRPIDQPTATVLSFQISGVEPGDYLVRVQIDGAASMPESDSEGLYNAPQRSIL